MNITVSYEFGKSKIKNFDDLISEVYHAMLGIGCEFVREVLEQTDAAILAERDVARYRCKGLQKTCVKTILGAVEYKRRVHVDNAAAEKQHCVHLLDEALDIKNPNCNNKLNISREPLIKSALPYRFRVWYNNTIKAMVVHGNEAGNIYRYGIQLPQKEDQAGEISGDHGRNHSLG